MVKFTKKEIIQANDWRKIIKAVNKQTPPESWIFRALEPTDDYKPKSGFPFTKVRVQVRSSFDKAWDSRSCNVASERWMYEAWMLREFKRAAYVYRSDL